jgi:hypothetical protein
MTDDRDYSLPRWRDPAWRAEVDAWVTDRTAEAGLRRTADGEQRAYPWSTVIQVGTETGPVWFKANGLGMRHEAPLYEVLQRRCPGHVLDPLALDVDRGWLLLPDGGRTLREVEGASTDLALWERMLVEYAQLQRALEPYVDELLGAGVPDARPERLPAIRDALLDDPELLMVGEPDGLTEAEVVQQRAHTKEYAEQCGQLAALGVAPSLQHDDLHANNVFAPSVLGGPLRVFDWGDSVVGHPFGTLLITLRVVSDLAGLQPGATELLRLRDAYLEAWTGDHDKDDLVEAARLAVRVDGVSRADCYRRGTMEWDGRHRPPFGEGVASWLKEQRGPMPI